MTDDDLRALAERLEHPRCWMRHQGMAIVADDAPHDAAKAIRAILSRATLAEERLARAVAALTAIRDHEDEENEWDGVERVMPAMRVIAATTLSDITEEKGE